MAEKVRILWQPNQDVIRSSNILRFVNWLDEVLGFGFEVSVDDPLRNVGNYDRLWRWSVEDLEGFWVSVWRYFSVVSHSPYTKVLEPRTMPGGARWFIGSRLNYAEHVFKAAVGGVRRLSCTLGRMVLGGASHGGASCIGRLPH